MSALNLYLLTFNCGRTPIKPDIVAEHVFQAVPSGISPDIIILHLQEIAPLGHAFLGGSFLTPYFNAFRQCIKLASTNAFYVNTISRNLGMTAIMIFVRDSLVANIAHLQTAGVGVGVQQTGNKGAVAIRMGYRLAEDDIMSMTFVSAHLAPMENALQKRNEDFHNIVKGLVFTPDEAQARLSRDEQSEDAPLLQGLPERGPGSQSGMYSPTSYLFFAGDLNYRTSEVKPTQEDYEQRFPRPTDDAKDARHFSHLLSQDQLTQQIQLGTTLNGFSEEPINFPPTYKYHGTAGQSVVTDEEHNWNWAAHRWPSWCDRIFYIDQPSAKLRATNYEALPVFATSDHRPVALSIRVPLRPLSADDLAEGDIRKDPPGTDSAWKANRYAARRKEIAVGLAAYLTWTYEGLGLLLATTLGIFGGYWVIRSLVE